MSSLLVPWRQHIPISVYVKPNDSGEEMQGNAPRAAFKKWENEIQRGLERFGMTSEDAGQIAITVLSQLEGALLLARTYAAPSRCGAPSRR
ncbi:MAG: hypothetical protein ACREEK_10540 [Bradyrhizobium sp.]